VRIRRIALWLLSLSVPALLAAQTAPLQHAWSLADQARELARSPQPQDSLPLYEEALRLAPDEWTIERDYGVALGWSGQYRKAAAVFRRIRQVQPEQPPWARQEMANAELFGGHAETAADLYRSLIEEGDLREVILTREALSLRRASRRSEAQEIYRETLGYYPDSETAAIGLVEILLDRRQVDEAHAFLVTWSQGRERSSQIRAWRGWLLTLLGRFDEAQQAFDAIPATDWTAQAAIVGRSMARRLRAEPFRIAPAPMPALSPAPSELATNLPGAETGRSLNVQSVALAAEGVALAREGSLDLGVAYLRRAVAMAPNHLGVRRDYAVVLTWDERYVEAQRQFDYVFEHQPSQPVWARSDRAQAELFGDHPKIALAMLNELLAEGYVDERNLVRKGLALRWSGQPKEAEQLYKQISALYPESSAGPDGLIHSLADQNRLGSAIKAANESLTRLPDHWDLIKSRAQVLNWAGRHLQAEKTLAALPAEPAQQGDALHHMALAARWSDDARMATEYARTFAQRYPGDREAYRLRDELAYAYGYAFQTRADYFADTDDFVSQGIRQQFEAPLSLSHRLDFGVNRQLFTQRGESASWTTYGVGWTGHVARRLTTRARAGQVFYGNGVKEKRLSLDASASYLVSDRVRLRGGVGREPTTAFHALQRQVQTQYAYAETDLRPTLKTQLGLRYSTIAFGSSTTRRSFDFSAFRRIVDTRPIRIRVGTRNGWVAHDRPSDDVYSPAFVRTHLGALHLEGRLPGDIDYVAEFGAGVQMEAGAARTIPFSSTVEVAKKLRQNIWLRLQGGHSNSALDRTNAGLSSYRMSYASIQLDYRLKREFR
jgi:tetratricopeptide (TPR) repeat protein